MTPKTLLILLLVLALSSGATSTAGVPDSLITWKGEVRVRGEIDGRDFQNSTPPNRFALLRTRIGAEIRPASDVVVLIQLQDARVFGQPLFTGSANTTADFKNIDLHQGFFQVLNFLTPGFGVALGRMELSYGNERIVGASDWQNTGRAFDAALFRYEHRGHSVDLFTSDVVDHSLPPSPVTRSSVSGMSNEGFLFSGLHYTNRVIEDHTINLYGFHEWSQQDTSTGEVDRSRITLGGLFQGTYAGFTYDAEGAYQLGKQSSVNISAFMVLGSLGYSFRAVPLTVVAGFEHLSGSPVGSTKVKAFHAPFATGHKAFGDMDYFTNIPLQTFGRGLEDMYVRVSLKPVESLTIAVKAHNFRFAEEYVGRTKLGQELDVVVTWVYDMFVLFELGGGGFIPEKVLEFAYGGEDPGLWGYCTARVRF